MIEKIKNNQYIPIVVIILFGLAIRVVYALKFDYGSIFAYDGRSYLSMAENFMSGKGLINTIGEVPVLTPIYPLFASLALYFTDQIVYLRLVQALLGSLTILLTYLLGKDLFGKKVAIVASLFAAIYPGLAIWVSFEITEVIFTFILMLILALILTRKSEHTYLYVVVVSILIGLLNLTRGVALFLPFMYVFYLYIENKKDFLKKGFVVVALSFLPLLAWGYRNLLVFNEFIPTAAHDGIALYVGNNPYTQPLEFHTAKSNDVDKELTGSLKGTPFLKKDQALKEAAINYMKNNPAQTVWNAAQRYWTFYRPTDIQISKKPYLGDRLTFMDYFLVFGAIGSAFYYGKLINDRKRLFVVSFILLFGLPYAITVVVKVARYRSPIMPLVALLASFFLVESWMRAKQIVRRSKD